ncbi:hypothetical protein SESBI_37052 [Sesbania bispinosa]|nr:hypothetical protein SESBI_37052 [Sesbania bispinosa]
MLKLEKGKTKVAAGKSKRGRPPTKNKPIPPTNQQPPATATETVQKNPTQTESTGYETNNCVQQLQVIKNAHETSMFMMTKCGSPLPPNMVEANKIIQELLDVAKQAVGFNIDASSDVGGTQHSEVTQTHPHEGSQGGVHPKTNN